MFFQYYLECIWVLYMKLLAPQHSLSSSQTKVLFELSWSWLVQVSQNSSSCYCLKLLSCIDFLSLCMHPYMGGLILFVTLTSCGANQQRKINGWHMHPLHSYEAHQQLKISVWNVQCALHAECIIDEFIIGILGSSIFRLTLCPLLDISVLLKSIAFVDVMAKDNRSVTAITVYY